jgi:hypothetical protein
MRQKGDPMAFIRKRISPSRRQTPSYQVIETYREDGKVKQRVLANLGCNPTPEEALSEFRKELMVTREVVEELERKCATKLKSSANVDRNFEKWSRIFARQRDTVDKLEALVHSGKKWTAQESPPSDTSSDSTGFLDWVIERNSSSWL